MAFDPTPTEPDFGRSVFVCSKPLQVMNCASIVRHFGLVDARLHVVTAFDDADGLRDFLVGTPYGELFSTISWHADHDDALGALSSEAYDSLFIEDDRVSSYLRFVPHRTRAMAIFEEGLGTYRNDADHTLRGLRRLKWKLLAATRGCGWDFGEGRRTDHVLVSRPGAYRRLKPHLAHKVIGFPGLVEELRTAATSWGPVVADAIGRPGERFGAAALVLGTWRPWGDAAHPPATTDADIVFHKAHPHRPPDAIPDDAIEIASPWIPAEALIEHLAPRCERLTVYHYSSSVPLYLHGYLDDVDLVDLDDSPLVREVLAALDS